MSITIWSISFFLNMVYSVKMYPIFMSLNKTVLQTINKSFETIHLDAKLNWILSALVQLPHYNIFPGLIVKKYPIFVMLRR